jgi:NAD(P)H-dependent FMN reductase
MDSGRPIFIPVILGTTRKGRKSEHVAKFMAAEIAKQENVETEIVDILNIPLPKDDAGEHIKDPVFSKIAMKADAFVIVAPEYNHGYPGMLKHALDTNLKEYIHKAVGVCGVSAGPFGGTRVIENMLPVLRELGFVTIFWDVNFSIVQKAFDESGKLLDEAYVKRAEKFINELIWMAKVLRYGRENVEI